MTSKPWDVYVRVSTDEQGSLPMQTAAAKSMVEIGQRQLGLVLTDDGYSAKDLHRPAMVKLLDRIDRGEIGGVVIYKLDRLTRSVRDLFSLLERLDKTGVALVSVRENIDTSSAMGRFFVGLIGLMAQWEREQLAERVKAGMSFIKSKGGYVGGRVPDGLAVEGDKAKKRLVKHPIWGDVVAQAWKRVSDGATLGELRDWLNEHRLATRKSAWTTTGVHRMLTNETYVGLVVDRHSFEKAKVAMAARQSPGKQGVKVVRREMQGDRVWPLRGLLLCPTCDAKMVGTTATNRHKQPYHFLRCSVRNRRGKQECSQGDLPAEPIELMVLQSLVGVLQRNSPEVLPALRQLQQAADRASGPLSDQRKALGLERDRIAGEMANLGTLAAAGGPTARS